MICSHSTSNFYSIACLAGKIYRISLLTRITSLKIFHLLTIVNYIFNTISSWCRRLVWGDTYITCSRYFSAVDETILYFEFVFTGKSSIGLKSVRWVTRCALTIILEKIRFIESCRSTSGSIQNGGRCRVRLEAVFYVIRLYTDILKKKIIRLTQCTWSITITINTALHLKTNEIFSQKIISVTLSTVIYFIRIINIF